MGKLFLYSSRFSEKKTIIDHRTMSALDKKIYGTNISQWYITCAELDTYMFRLKLKNGRNAVINKGMHHNAKTVKRDLSCLDVVLVSKMTNNMLKMKKLKRNSIPIISIVLYDYYGG